MKQDLRATNIFTLSRCCLPNFYNVGSLRSGSNSFVTGSNDHLSTPLRNQCARGWRGAIEIPPWSRQHQRRGFISSAPRRDRASMKGRYHSEGFVPPSRSDLDELRERVREFARAFWHSFGMNFGTLTQCHEQGERFRSRWHTRQTNRTSSLKSFGGRWEMPGTCQSHFTFFLSLS